MITLRVLAPNFPNQVNDLEAPLLPHPNGNTITTPMLTCTVTSNDGYDFCCHVNAVPDSGCSGNTIISKNFAMKVGIHVFPKHFELTAASNTPMEVSGEAFVSISVTGQAKIIHRKVAVTNITDHMLLSWRDLISLGVLPGDFPSPAPE